MAETKNPNKALNDTIDVLVARAPELLAAGYTSISISGIAATLERPPPMPGVDDDQPRPTRQPSDPLRDPKTYPGGRRRGGFERPGRV